MFPLCEVTELVVLCYCGAGKLTQPLTAQGSDTFSGGPEQAHRGSPGRSPISRILEAGAEGFVGFKIHPFQPMAPFLLDSGVQVIGPTLLPSTGL